MSASPKLRFGIAAAALSCLIAGYVVAQQVQVREREDAALDQPATGQIERPATERREYRAAFRGERADTGTSNQDVQRYIVGCLLAKNQAEVEMGKFAQQQAQNPEVKEFAQMIVQDHGKLVQQLQKLNSPQAGDRATTTTDAAGQDVAERTTTDAATLRTGGNSAVDQLLALDRQIVERCSQMAKDELQQKQGAEFDKCFIGAQIGNHMQSLAALEVLQQQGPEQIQQIAQQAQPVVQQHLEHAKQIMQKLEGQNTTGANRAARQPTQPQR
jgi:putative membrane protein